MADIQESRNRTSIEANVPDEATTSGDQARQANDKPSPSKTKKRYMTACLYCCTLIEGLCFGVRAATLLDIQKNTSASIWEVSVGLITSLSVGWIAGGLVGGIFFDRLNQQLYLGCSAVAAGVCVLAAPWYTHIAVVGIFYCLMGFWLAFMDAGALTLTCQIWKEQSGPYILAQEICYGVGSFLGPLLVSIFQSASDKLIMRTIHSNATFETSDCYHNKNVFNISGHNGTDMLPHQEISYNYLFQYAYIVPASFSVLVSLPFFVNAVQKNKTRPHQPSQDENADVKEKDKFHIKLLVLMTVAGFIYNGMEDTSSGLMKSFIVEYVNLSQSNGNLLLSIYWGVYTGYRIVGIIETNCLHPGTILIIHQVALVVGYLLLLVTHFHPSVIWIAVVFIAMSHSPTFATNITFWGQYVQMTGKVMAIIFVTEGLGSVICPPIISKLIDTFGYGSFPYSMIGMNVVGLLLRIIMHIYARLHSKGDSDDNSGDAGEMGVEMSVPS